MQSVPVLSSTGQRLMPCHAARIRQLVRGGRAVRRFDRGLFYIQLLDRAGARPNRLRWGLTRAASWNRSFSPIEVGKHWFYQQLGHFGQVHPRQGYETKAQRDALGLKKSKQKISDRFEAHCVDSWVLANGFVGGHTAVDNTAMLYVVPLRFYRRPLHRLQPAKGGVRKPYGGTLSLGFKRGSWVKHPKWGVGYLGGTTAGMVSLHSMQTSKRIAKVKPATLQYLTLSSWRIPHRAKARCHLRIFYGHLGSCQCHSGRRLRP